MVRRLVRWIAAIPTNHGRDHFKQRCERTRPTGAGTNTYRARDSVDYRLSKLVGLGLTGLFFELMHGTNHIW